MVDTVAYFGKVYRVLIVGVAFVCADLCFGIIKFTPQFGYGCRANFATVVKKNIWLAFKFRACTGSGAGMDYILTLLEEA